jgi:diguanylate cyclase
MSPGRDGTEAALRSRSNPLQCTPVGAAPQAVVLVTITPTMPQMTEIPLVASAALATASASLTAFGLRRRPYAGWRWWVAAMWLTTLGTALGALWKGDWGVALSAPLLLQWPLLTLMGLRRFHARQAWPGSLRIDALLLGVASLVAVLGSLVLGAESSWLLAGCGLVVHLYAAVVLFMGPSGADTTPVQGLGAAMALVAFAPGAAALASELAASTPLLSTGPSAAGLALQVRAVAAALGAIVLAFVALTLVCERTERQLRESRRRLRQLANMDALTQVPNRRHFAELAVHALQQDPPGSAVLLLFDVDHFKQINDHLGHAAGDRALCLVSGSVVEHLRAPDVAGRHGGDEFVLLLRQASTRDAMSVAARIVAQVQARAESLQLPTITLSFGLVQVGAGEELDAALRRADQALYEAKRQGRARAVAALGDERQPVFSESRPLGLLPA